MAKGKPRKGGGKSRKKLKTKNVAGGPQSAVSRIIKERESRGIAKKNKEFLSLKRDIEQRAKQSKKNAKSDETNLGSYVDRDRAAATASIKDIKSELKSKKKRDRLELMGTNQKPVVDEDVDKETYVLQGEHELKLGNPKSALLYLSKACTICDETDIPDPEPYLLRSDCYNQLGKYAEAEKDASVALDFHPGSLKAHLSKASSLYNLGLFEYALMNYHRAHLLRPKHRTASNGINQSVDAIKNSLCKFNDQIFLQMEPIIEAMVEAEERLLLEQEIEYRSILGGQDYITDPSFFEQGQQASTSRTAVDFITLSELKDSEVGCHGAKQQQLQTETLKKTEASYDFVNAITAKMDNLVLERPVFPVSQDRSKKAKVDRYQQQLQRANKELLGKLYYDQVYLSKLVQNPQILKKRPGVRVDRTQRKILATAQEGLEYLAIRKEFWQQEKPIFSRRNELAAKKLAIYAK